MDEQGNNVYPLVLILAVTQYTLYDFGLSETKDDKSETIETVSWSWPPNSGPMSYCEGGSKMAIVTVFVTKRSLQKVFKSVRHLG